MVTGTEMREAWECGTCGVVSRNPRLGAALMPERWDRDDEGRPRCLACSREADPDWRERRKKITLDTASPEERAAREAERGRIAEERKRRRAEELEEARRQRTERRAAERAERERAARAAFLGMDDAGGPAAVERVATEVGIGVAVAKRVRAELAREGRVAVRRGGPKGPRSDYAGALRAALEADPGRLDGIIAEEVGCDPQAVRRSRRRLGIKSSREVQDERAAAAVVAVVAGSAKTSAQQVADETGTSFATAKRRLDALAGAGRLRRLDVPNPRKGEPRTLYAPPTRVPT